MAPTRLAVFAPSSIKPEVLILTNRFGALRLRSTVEDPVADHAIICAPKAVQPLAADQPTICRESIFWPDEVRRAVSRPAPRHTNESHV